MPGGNLAHLWLIVGLILMGLEIMAAGVYLLWFGLAALLTAAFVYIFDPGLAAQFAVFAVLSVVCTLVGNRVYHRVLQTSEKIDQLSDPVQSDLVGMAVVLKTAIKGGIGKAQILDSIRPVHGPDLPAGTRVEIVEVSGHIIRVAVTKS